MLKDDLTLINHQPLNYISIRLRQLLPTSPKCNILPTRERKQLNSLSLFLYYPIFLLLLQPIHKTQRLKQYARKDHYS